MYADRETDSMKKAISETRRRRALQEAYNTKHGITPTTIEKAIQELAGTAQDDFVDLAKVKLPKKGKKRDPRRASSPASSASSRRRCSTWPKQLEFEKAAAIRDRIKELEQMALATDVTSAA